MERNLSQNARFRQIAAEATDKLQLDLFDGPHAWSGRSSEAFFRTHLG